MAVQERLRGLAPQLGAAVPMWMLQLVVLAVFLTVAEQLALSAAQTTSWIMALFGVPAILSIVTSFAWKQPVAWTSHLFAVILFGSLAGEAGFSELAGASIVAGVLVVLLALTGWSGRLASWIPLPIVMGLIAGAVAPLVWQMFTAFGNAPAVVGSVFVGYVVGERFLKAKVPSVFPALVAGVVAAGVTGQFGAALPAPSWPEPQWVTPSWSLDVMAATVPILVVFMTVQTSVPWAIYLRSQGYRPPERGLDVAGGSATVVGSLLGPTAAVPAVAMAPLLAGPGAGDHAKRHRSAYAVGTFGLLIAAGASLAVPVAMFVPAALIVAVAGLALLGVLASALKDVVGGPLQLGPVVAFAVALSDISMLGLGPLFWALVLGLGASYVLEPEGWATLHPRRARAGDDSEE